MANILANLCLNVETAGLKVSWAGTGANPPAGPFYARVFWKQSDRPDAVKCDSVSLDATGAVRIIVYDSAPGSVPTDFYTAATFIDSRMAIGFTGDYSLVSGGGTNPWPPT